MCTRIALVAVRISVSLAFVWAALGKLASRESSGTLWARHMRERPALASAIIAAELALAVWVMSGIAKRVAAIIVGFVLAGFSGLLVIELAKRNPVPCGCFGVQGQAYARQSLMVALSRNVFLLSGCFLTFWAGGYKRHERDLGGARSLPALEEGRQAKP